MPGSHYFSEELSRFIHRERMSLSIEMFILLFFAGLLAGFVDSIAGGGGLISLPALLSVGLPPQVALGTNKLQGTFGVCTAAMNFVKKGQVNLKECGLGIVATLIGAMIGTVTLHRVDAQFISHLIPFLLLFVFLYSVCSKNLGVAEKTAKMPVRLYYLLFGLLLGFYDGFFGPGTGSFWTASLLMALGYNLTKAVGVTKVMNFTSNLVALTIFTISGNLNVSAGLTMAISQIIGAKIGSNLAIQRGASFIRPIFSLIVLLTVIRLFYKNYF